MTSNKTRLALDRRGFLAAAAGAVAAPALAALRSADSVVLYSSIDDFILRDLVKAFETDTGVTVQVVGDTEATKTTGLVQRLLAERRKPRADVWWSSEPYGTIRLAGENVLEPYTSPAEADLGGAWPEWLRTKDKTWYGFALRARCIAHGVRVKLDERPRYLRDLTDPKWKGRIGMARPQFGTTRGHMAALLELFGEELFVNWLKGVKANRIRLYDGNSTVVRSLRAGEIDLGLTDTDDVLVAEKVNGWSVGMTSERADREPPPAGALPSKGAIPIASTVGRVKGGPNAAAAAKLIDFLLSEKVEEMLVRSPARFQPLREAVKRRNLESEAAGGLQIDFVRIAARVEDAMRHCRAILG